jgi:Cu/Ag efflux protein CusF
MKSKLSVMVAAGVLSLGFAGASLAQDHSQRGGVMTASSGTAAMTTGEVKKVDLEQRKVTIKHGAITNLDMPAMTMVFRAQSPDLLKGLNAGDQISFRAESVNGAMLVTQIQK